VSRITDVKTIRVVLTVCMSGPDREKEENNDDDKRKRREEEMRKKNQMEPVQNWSWRVEKRHLQLKDGSRERY
jgi:hypothetical protein